jgi:hypothetical protein
MSFVVKVKLDGFDHFKPPVISDHQQSLKYEDGSWGSGAISAGGR